MKLFTKNQTKNLKAGFTLVELLVTMVIFVVITTVVLFKSNSFDNSVLLNNFAYDVALTIKQAQSYGVNVKENVSGAFDTAYGVYFDIGPGGSRTNFVLFNDTTDCSTYSYGCPLGTAPIPGNPDFMYNGIVTKCPVDDLECMQKYSMTRGTGVYSICAGSNENDCDSKNGITKKLSILFKRPNLGAIIYSSDGNSLSANNSYAKIVLSATGGATSTIVVTSAGQIYIQKKK